MASVPAPAYAGSITATGSGTTLTFTPSPKLAPGQWIIAHTVINGNRSVSSSSFGTAIVTFYDSGGDVTESFWAYQIQDSNAGATTFTVVYSGAAGSFFIGELDVIDNVLPGYSPVIAYDSAYASSSTSYTSNAVTTDEANSVVFVFVRDKGEGATYSAPSGFTTARAGAASGFGVFYKTFASAGGTGSITGTVSPSAQSAGFTIAFAPNTAGVRLYFDSTTGGAITPGSFAAGWDLTGSAITRQLVATAGSSAMTSTGVAETSTTNAYDVCIYRGVYGPIGSGTIDGMVRGIARFQESNAAANDIVQCIIRRVNSGGTHQATLYAGTSITSSSPASEFATSLTNRIIPHLSDARSLTSDSSTNGDYVVVEIGYRANNTSSTSRTGTFRHGDTAGTDAAFNESDTADNRPWFQFDNGLPAYSAGGSTVHLLPLLGVGA